MVTDIEGASSNGSSTGRTSAEQDNLFPVTEEVENKGGNWSETSSGSASPTTSGGESHDGALDFLQAIFYNYPYSCHDA